MNEEKFSLETTEIRHLAELKDHPGYTLLIDRVQAELDTLQQEFLVPGTPVNTEMVLYWRGLSRILAIFKVIPDQMQQEFKILRDNMQFNAVQEHLETAPQEYLERLLDIYQKKKKANKV